MKKDITQKKFEDLDRSDFTDEEFQNLVDYIKLLLDMNKKSQVVKFDKEPAYREPIEIKN